MLSNKSPIDRTLIFLGFKERFSSLEKKQFVIDQLHQTGLILRAIMLGEARGKLESILGDDLSISPENRQSILEILKGQLRLYF